MKRLMPGRRQWADSVGCPLPCQAVCRAWNCVQLITGHRGRPDRAMPLRETVA